MHSSQFLEPSAAAAGVAAGAVAELHSLAVSQQGSVPCCEIYHWTSSLASTLAVPQGQPSCWRQAPRLSFGGCGPLSQHNEEWRRHAVARGSWVGSQIGGGH